MATVIDIEGDISELKKHLVSLLIDVIKIRFEDGFECYVPLDSVEEYLKE